MKESTLTTKIIKALRAHGGFWVKIHGSAFQTTGIPDILGCYKGRFVALEVKVPGKENTLSQRQRLILDRVSKAGGTSSMITSTRGALKVLLELDTELL